MYGLGEMQQFCHVVWFKKILYVIKDALHNTHSKYTITIGTSNLINYAIERAK